MLLEHFAGGERRTPCGVQVFDPELRWSGTQGPTNGHRVEELSHLDVVGTLARMHLKPLKTAAPAHADPLIAVAGDGGRCSVQSIGDAWTAD